MKCPICKKGELPEPKGQTRYDKSEAKKKMARVLVNNGFSYRQIASFIGWKSTQSVSKAIK